MLHVTSLQILLKMIIPAFDLMLIRPYKVDDTAEIMQLFYNTVHEINICDYTSAQVEAWAPKNMDTEFWLQGLSSKFTYVAVELNKIIGFGELEANGHIDRFYCHHEYQKQGVGTKLLEQIEIKAQSLGIKQLFTEASITAKPFFISKGFTVVKMQEVERRGEKLTNFVMKKPIK